MSINFSFILNHTKKSLNNMKSLEVAVITILFWHYDHQLIWKSNKSLKQSFKPPKPRYLLSYLVYYVFALEWTKKTSLHIFRGIPNTDTYTRYICGISRLSHRNETVLCHSKLLRSNLQSRFENIRTCIKYGDFFLISLRGWK